jgi:superfamily II DNA/RNA helicase
MDLVTRHCGSRSEYGFLSFGPQFTKKKIDASLIPRTGVQIILFSATFPNHVRNFASKFAPNANKIELQREELSVEGIRQFYMDCRDEEHKYDILVSLYQLLTIGQSIIFCQVSQVVPACSYLTNHTSVLLLASPYSR